MNKATIVGIGQTPVGEHWTRSLGELAAEAARAALADAGRGQVDALFVGNMASGELSAQQNLGAMVADYCGLVGVEAVRIEAACASGAAALRIAAATVEAGLYETALVVGVEKMTDRSPGEVTTALAAAADADFEADHGLSFVALNALMMRRYLYEHGVDHAEFAPFVINAHHNALANEAAMLRFPVTAAEFVRAKMVADPIHLLDSAPVCDGAAAVLIAAAGRSRSSARAPRAVTLRGAAMATDSLALHDRADLLRLACVARSTERALETAGVKRADLDLLELHDAFSIMTVLSLEAAGFAPPGKGTRLGATGAIARDGELPLSTLGGLKARGHPVGATGVYQVVEAVRQLRGEAGAAQVANARLALTQNIGGSASTAVTIILEARD